jgi:hypothetical protein
MGNFWALSKDGVGLFMEDRGYDGDGSESIEYPTVGSIAEEGGSYQK